MSTSTHAVRSTLLTLLAAAVAAVALFATAPARAAAPSTDRVAPLHDNSIARKHHTHRYQRRFLRSRHLVVGGRRRLVAVLRFKLTPLPAEGSNAVLRLYVRGASRKGLVVRRAKRHGTRFRFSHARVRTGRVRKGWVSIDVTGLVGTRKRVTLAVSSRSRRPLEIASREARRKRPGLVVRRRGGGATVPGVPTPAGLPGTAGIPSMQATRVVMAVGDTCSSGGSPECAAVADVIRSQHPDAFLHLGDLQYQDGNQSAFDAGYGRIFSDLHSITYPVFGSTHDFGWSGYPVSFMNLHSAVAGKLSNNQWGYSFDVGAWHVVALNYNHPDPAALEADLAAHPSRCLLAFDHAPYLGTPTSTHPSNELSRAFVTPLFNHGVDLMLNGHNHVYERLAPQNIDKQADPNGTVVFQVGTGGIGHYSFTSTAPNSLVRSTTAFGALKLALSPTGWASQYINAPGSNLTDTATGSCGP